MRIYIRLGEPFWRSVGQRDFEMTVRPPSTVASLIAELCGRHPNLSKELAEAPPIYFIDDLEVEPDALLHADCRVYLVWPITGG